jgi:hypothetical protein
MKHVASFVLRALVCGVTAAAVVVPFSAQAQSKENRARVEGVRGNADYSDAGGEYRTLSPGMSIPAGSVVRTGAGSEVQLYLAQNGPIVVVREDSLLGLESLSYDSTGAEVVIDTRLELKAGRVSGHVRRMASASKYDVRIPNGVVSVRAMEARGAQYVIEVTGRATVQNGTLTVVFNNVTYTVNSGQTFDPTIPGVRPATPEEIDGTKVPPVIVPVVEVRPAEEIFVSPLVGARASAPSLGEASASSPGGE